MKAKQTKVTPAAKVKKAKARPAKVKKVIMKAGDSFQKLGTINEEQDKLTINVLKTILLQRTRKCTIKDETNGNPSLYHCLLGEKIRAQIVHMVVLKMFNDIKNGKDIDIDKDEWWVPDFKQLGKTIYEYTRIIKECFDESNNKGVLLNTTDQVIDYIVANRGEEVIEKLQDSLTPKRKTAVQQNQAAVKQTQAAVKQNQAAVQKTKGLQAAAIQQRQAVAIQQAQVPNESGYKPVNRPYGTVARLPTGVHPVGQGRLGTAARRSRGRLP